MSDDTESTTEQQWICRTCRRPLNDHMTYTDGVLTAFRFVHPLDVTDHEPDPIPREFVPGDEVRTKCDFCGDMGTAWSYPCKDFEVIGATPMADAPGWGSVGQWAACETCHKWIERGYWDRILEKAIRSLDPVARANVRPQVRVLHSMFRRHRLGPAIPLWKRE